MTKLSRILSIWHLFLNCKEVSYDEFIYQFGMFHKKTIHQDILLLQEAGVLKVKYSRKQKAFIPTSLKPSPMAPQENKTRQKYLEKVRRLCILMERMSQEDREDGMNKNDLYREIFPGISDRTRQRDFVQLDELGYRAWYNRDDPDEPGRWSYKIPEAYELETFP